MAMISCDVFRVRRPLVKKNSLSICAKYRSILDKESGAIAGIVIGEMDQRF